MSRGAETGAQEAEEGGEGGAERKDKKQEKTLNRELEEERAERTKREMERGKGRIRERNRGERRIARIGEAWEKGLKKWRERVRYRRERRERRILKEVKVKERKRKEAVEEIFQNINVKVKIGKARKLGRNAEKGAVTILVKLESERQRRGKVWENKKQLRGSKEKIVEDLIWEERKMTWRLEEIVREIVREEERKENRA